MDEEKNILQPLATSGMADEFERGLPMSSAFRFPSMEDDHDRDDEDEDVFNRARDDRDSVPQLSTPPPPSEFNPLQEAHPASRLLRWLFGLEFLFMIPLLPLEMVLPEEWSWLLILLYSLLLLAHVLIALSMFGLLYDPWHNNIVKALRVHQGVLACCSLLMLVLFAYLGCADSWSAEGDHDAAIPEELSSVLGPHGRSLPYHLGSATVWAVTLLICTRCFVTLTRQKFDITTGTGCCPVIRCRACRVTCFLGLPDAAVGLRYHQHQGDSRGYSEGISISTLHKRELSSSKPRTLPLPGEDGSDHGPGHFDKRGSVDYFAPIWKTQSAITLPRPNSDIDTPRLSGSAPSEWSRWPARDGAPSIEIKQKKESSQIVSRSVGNAPIVPFGKAKAELRAPLLSHMDSSEKVT